MHDEKEFPEVNLDSEDEAEVIIDGDQLLEELAAEEQAAKELAAEDEVRTAEQPVDEAGGDVDRLTAELEAMREQYLRKLAEFDNFRKRTERERAELERIAGEALVCDLLPVLDNFERAVEHAPDADLDVYHQGIEMIAKQLWDVLERRGLERIDPRGEPFQPEFHEAVQRIEDSDCEPGTVVTVLTKGYLFGGRLVRPAMVTVAVEPSVPVQGAGSESEDGGEEVDAS